MQMYLSDDISNAREPYIYLAGLTSFGTRICNVPGWPSVFTKVSDHIDWIVSHMRS